MSGSPVFYLDNGLVIQDNWTKFFREFPEEVHNVISYDNINEGWQRMFIEWDEYISDEIVDYSPDQYRKWNRNRRMANQVQRALYTSIEYGYATPDLLKAGQ